MMTRKDFLIGAASTAATASAIDGESIDGSWGRARGLMGGAFMGTLLAQSGSWKNPYVTSGLELCIDGEWNAGGGKHIDQISKIVNIVDDSDFVFCTANVGQDYLQLTQRVTVNNQLSNNIANAWAKDSTIEICANLDSANFTYSFYSKNYSPVCDLTRSINNHVIGFAERGGFIFRWLNTEYGPSPTTVINSKLSYTVMPKQTATFVRGDDYVKYIANGGTYSETRNYNSAYNSYIGFCSYGVKILSMRVYSRQLTTAEIAANYAVDKARFGLT